MSDIQKDNKDGISKKTDLHLQLNFNVFLKNKHHSFAVLKTEKLASALYMITGFVSESDPLRTRLRTCALDLVSCVTDGKKEGRSADHERFGARCLEIGSMLCMAERAGLISPMNSKVLCEEYATLGSFVELHRDQVFGDHIDISAEIPASPPRHALRAQGRVPVVQKSHVPKKTSNYKRHQNRRQLILSLFNKKDKINVKDASVAIEGCSEKTIQRELTAMVNEGVLLKEGERRWSVYKKAI